MSTKRIAIAGGSGFIGRQLQDFFKNKEIELVLISRNDLTFSSFDKLMQKLEGCEVVINLAGASIDKAWTNSYKKEIYSSRIETTQNLVKALNAMPNKARLFISASAVGYYPNGKEQCNESQLAGDDFLASVCADWEKASADIDPRIRRVNARFGLVFAKKGGVFPRISMFFRFRLGLIMGNGKQHLSWIHIQDLMRILHFFILHEEIQGPVNCTASHSPSYIELVRTICSYRKCLLQIRIPRFFLQLFLGERQILLCASKSAYPKVLLEAGFCFQYPTLQAALEELLGDKSESSYPN